MDILYALAAQSSRGQALDSDKSDYIPYCISDLTTILLPRTWYNVEVTRKVRYRY